MFSHILTSIIGKHSNIQDAIKFFEDDNKIVAIVADGLGSRKMSAHGARLICSLLMYELKEKCPPLVSSDLASPQKWHEYLKSKLYNCDDFCTTCSFVLIDKNSQQVCVGQIGDSPIFIKTDNNPVIEFRLEKEFSNCTDSLGGRDIKVFNTQNFLYNKSIRVMVTSDGIGDELCSSRLDSLFEYLCTTYQEFSPKSRSRRFTKEIKSIIGKVNNDDKSAIFIWTV